MNAVIQQQIGHRVAGHTAELFEGFVYIYERSAVSVGDISGVLRVDIQETVDATDFVSV
jgi:hypothetical protein